MMKIPSMVLGLVIIFLFLIITPFTFADLEITINETGKITSFYDQFYIYQLEGNLSVHNPTEFELFNIELPYYLSTLSVRANYSSAENYMAANKLFVYSLNPNQTVRFAYRIVGITTEDLSTNNESILKNGLLSQQPKIYSNLFGTLKKADFEDATYTGRNNTRLVSVEFRNPTGFNYTIDKVEVIKTLVNDPNAEIDRWSFTGQKNRLLSFEGWDFDFLDTDAYEGEIYWLNTDIYVDQIKIEASSNISRYDQDDLFEVISNATLNETVENETFKFLADRIYLRKLSTSTLMTPGDIVNMTVVVNNFKPQKIAVSVIDPVPSGFEVVKVYSGKKSGDNITWNANISSGTLKRLKYTLRYTDEGSLGLDYFRPAMLTFDGKTFYSQSIPFVRKYIPSERVFVQKSVKFLTGEEVQITINMKNMGESDLHNIVVKEHLLSSAEFREITVPPEERGLWRIENLDQGSDWETSYITDRASVLNTMPEIYGISQGAVMQTIILSNLISSTFSLIPTSIVEIVSVIILGVIIVLYFLPANFFSRTVKRQKRDLGVMSHELDNLKHSTEDRGVSLHSPVQQQAPQQSKPIVAPNQHMQDPARVARHNALDETASLLEKSKEKLENKPKEPKEEKKD